jgi:hypothetical protein
VISRIFIILCLCASTLAAGPTKKLKYPKKYYRKIASVYDAKRGNEVFNKLMACKEIEKNDQYMAKFHKCVQDLTDPEVLERNKRNIYRLKSWVQIVENPSSLSACDIETITDFPSVEQDPNNDIVLCMEVSMGSKQVKAVVLFNQRGNKLYFRGARY